MEPPDDLLIGTYKARADEIKGGDKDEIRGVLDTRTQLHRACRERRLDGEQFEQNAWNKNDEAGLKIELHPFGKAAIFL